MAEFHYELADPLLMMLRQGGCFNAGIFAREPGQMMEVVAREIATYEINRISNFVFENFQDDLPRVMLQAYSTIHKWTRVLLGNKMRDEWFPRLTLQQPGFAVSSIEQRVKNVYEKANREFARDLNPSPPSPEGEWMLAIRPLPLNEFLLMFLFQLIEHPVVKSFAFIKPDNEVGRKLAVQDALRKTWLVSLETKFVLKSPPLPLPAPAPSPAPFADLTHQPVRQSPPQVSNWSPVQADPLLMRRSLNGSSSKKLEKEPAEVEAEEEEDKSVTSADAQRDSETEHQKTPTTPHRHSHHSHHSHREEKRKSDRSHHHKSRPPASILKNGSRPTPPPLTTDDLEEMFSGTESSSSSSRHRSASRSALTRSGLKPLSLETVSSEHERETQIQTPSQVPLVAPATLPNPVLTGNEFADLGMEMKNFRSLPTKKPPSRSGTPRRARSSSLTNSINTSPPTSTLDETPDLTDTSKTALVSSSLSLSEQKNQGESETSE